MFNRLTSKVRKIGNMCLPNTRKKRVFWGIIVGGILLNLLLCVSKEHLIRMTALKLVGGIEVMAATQDVDPDSLTTKDFSDIPGVTQEYVDAFKLFLKAKAQDRGEDTYDKAIAAFEKIAATTENPELKLRSLYIITFSNFLQMRIAEAHKTGMEVLKLSRSLYEGDKRIVFLDKIISLIQRGEIQGVSMFKEILEGEGEEALGVKEAAEASGFSDDLFLLPERTQELEEMKAQLD